MHDLMSQRKSGFLLGVSLLITAVIGGFLFFPIIYLYLPYDYTHVGILVPSIGRKGYVFPTYHVSASGNGQLVAFTSNANSLRYGNSDSNKGLFLYNRHTDETKQISTGLWHPAVSIEHPKISEDGNFIVFFFFIDNKIRDRRPEVALYLYDTSEQTTKEIILPDEIKTRLRLGNDVKISQDGRYIWFQAGISIFLHDQLANTTTSLSNLLFPPTSGYEIVEFKYLSEESLLFSATNGQIKRYGVYNYAQLDYKVIPLEQYAELSQNRREAIPADIKSVLRTNYYYKLLALSADQNTAVLSIAENVPELADFDLTSNLYQFNRQTGGLRRIPIPNWKLSVFIILTAANMLLAGYILFTDSRDKRPFPIP